MLWRMIRVGALLFSLSVCLAHGAVTKPPDTGGPSSCSQEMCVFLFDRLEEQSVRLHNLEAVLLRTVSILTSTDGQNLSTAIATLKGDPLINSLSTSMDYDPVESFVLHPVPSSDNLESHNTGRRKRQAEVQPMSPKERLIEALKWSKKNRDVRTVDATESRSVQASGVETSIELRQETQRYSRASLSEISNQGSEPSKKNIPFSREAAADLNTSAVTEKTLPEIPDPMFTNVTFSDSETKPFQNLSVTSVPAPVFTNVTLPPKYITNADVITSEEFPSSYLERMASQKFVKEAVGDLQGALKCAMGQLNDHNTSEPLGVLFDPQANLNPNKTLTVQFELKDCHKYWVGVWVRVTVRSMFIDVRNENDMRPTEDQIVLQIPKQCWKKKGNVFWLTLPSSSKAPCSFPLINLMECKIYGVDFIPMFFTLQGQPVFTDITVPPQTGGNSTDLSVLEQVPLSSSTNELALKWSAQSSDCAKLMTSVDLKIYQDESDVILRTYRIQSDCMGSGISNSFSTHLSSHQYICPSILWQPLDVCRKYKLELEPEYSSTWRGKSSSLEIFTPGISQSSCCHVLTNANGTFRSINDGMDLGCNWLISIEKNSTIYLSFTESQISRYRLKIFDGPYFDSPLIIDHYGNSIPNPIKSRSNKLFINLEFQRNSNYWEHSSKSFTAHYISVCNDKKTEESGSGKVT